MKRTKASIIGNNLLSKSISKISFNIIHKIKELEKYQYNDSNIFSYKINLITKIKIIQYLVKNIKDIDKTRRLELLLGRLQEDLIKININIQYLIDKYKNHSEKYFYYFRSINNEIENHLLYLNIYQLGLKLQLVLDVLHSKTKRIKIKLD